MTEATNTPTDTWSPPVSDVLLQTDADGEPTKLEAPMTSAECDADVLATGLV